MGIMKDIEPISFGTILEYNDSKDNLAAEFSLDERNKIASEVTSRRDRDEQSMNEWLGTVDKGLDIVSNRYEPKIKPSSDHFNIQFPLLINAVNTVSARLFTEIHKEIYITHCRILGKDNDNIKEDAIQRIKRYIQALVVDYAGSDWMESQTKLYPRYTLMGTQIKQVRFDDQSMTVETGLVPYKDVFINHKSESLEKAPAVSIYRYLTQNEVMGKIRSKHYLPFDMMERSQTDKAHTITQMLEESRNNNKHTYDNTIKVIEQHCWLDLDDDGYNEPYLAHVACSSGELLRLVPIIDTELSKWETENETKLTPIVLIAEKFFADYHYIPNPDGGFWSIGLAHLIAPTNCVVNDLLNNMANVATMATNQGGIIGLGGRHMAGRHRLDSTKLNPLPVSAEDLNKAIVKFDIKDPSPVIKELAMLLIDTGEKMGALNEALSGEMPNRELPAHTMLMLVEQSLKNSQAIYKRVHNALTKEVLIVVRNVLRIGNAQHYKDVLDDEQADLATDFDLKKLDFSVSSDASSSGTSEKLLKLSIIEPYFQNEMFASRLNVDEFLKTLITTVDLSSPEKLILPPAEPQPDPTIEVANRELEGREKADNQKHERETRKLELDEQKIAAEAAKDRAVGVQAIAKADAEGIKAEATMFQALKKDVESKPNQETKGE